MIFDASLNTKTPIKNANTCIKNANQKKKKIMLSYGPLCTLALCNNGEKWLKMARMNLSD